MDPMLAPAYATAGGYRYAPSRRSRAGSALAALAVVAIIVLVLWRMGLLDPAHNPSAEHLTSVTLQKSGSSQAPSPHITAKAPEAARTHRVAPVVTTTQQAPKVAIKPRPPLTDKQIPAFIAMSGADMAAGDISKMKGSGSGGHGASHGSTYGPGEGPGGTSLVNVDWYRRPTDAEMSTYLPSSVPAGSWATISCRMIEHYHVEDCQELDESPPGSHLSRALRQAAWQFLVRPPSVNGRPQIGTQVRIRFTWGQHGE